MAAPTSNAQLAQLLSESYQKIDRLTESLAAEKHRAEHYQRIAESSSSSSSSPQNGHGAELLLERVRVAEERAYIAERQRDEEVVQRETITRLWHQLRDYLALLDAHSKSPDSAHPHVDVFPQRRKRRSSEEHGVHKKARPNSQSDIDDMILEAAVQDSRRSREPTYPQPVNTYPPSARSSKLLSDATIPALQTHIFTPVITGAPSKKARYNSNSQIHDAASTSTTSLVSASGEPTKIYPAVNELGQRTCRNCGNAGRYKEDKCVEKWGPGPMGPGTVCDRCRKKIKRFERRGTLVSVDPVPQLARNNLPQAPIIHVPKRQDTLLAVASPRPSPPRIIQRASPEEDAEADADGDAEAEPEDVDELDGDGAEDAMAEDDDLLDAVDASESNLTSFVLVPCPASNTR
ncbi:hypothetical protein BDZ89DRAFT_1161627 [Hymenopellis radicata]|nr:hypothetical protein BDZ89DRAFT_1161627 [Hymenopellis radicata]